MKRIVIVIASLLLAIGCARKDETDWIIGKWYLTACTYVNKSGGHGVITDPGFKSWEFTARKTVIIDGERVQSYWHKNGHLSIESTVYDLVLHGRDMMQLERTNVNGVTTYTFGR